MIQDKAFAITFESMSMIENHRHKAPAFNPESLDLEYDTSTAQILYWIFVLNLKLELSHKKISMEKAASELQLEPQHLTMM